MLTFRLHEILKKAILNSSEKSPTFLPRDESTYTRLIKTNTEIYSDIWQEAFSSYLTLHAVGPTACNLGAIEIGAVHLRIPVAASACHASAEPRVQRHNGPKKLTPREIFTSRITHLITSTRIKDPYRMDDY